MRTIGRETEEGCPADLGSVVAGSGRLTSPRSVRIGALAAGGMAATYAAVVGGSSGSVGHLIDQVRSDWYLPLPIIAGFGVQVGLLAELRSRRRMHRDGAAAGAAGAGASTMGMAACCANHLADLVPFVDRGPERHRLRQLAVVIPAALVVAGVVALIVYALVTPVVTHIEG